MAEELKVVSVTEILSEFDKNLIPRIAEEVIKRTDQRYFTRERIYIFMIGFLISAMAFAWNNSRMINNIKHGEPAPIQKPTTQMYHNAGINYRHFPHFHAF